MIRVLPTPTVLLPQKFSSSPLKSIFTDMKLKPGNFFVIISKTLLSYFLVFILPNKKVDIILIIILPI